MQLRRKKQLLQKRRWRIRKHIRGTAERPRLVVTFTGQHIHAQCIDDRAGQTLAALSTTSKSVRDENLKANVASASIIGRKLGEQAKAQGIQRVVFDRAGRRYHGCVKAFADAAREAGLEF